MPEKKWLGESESPEWKNDFRETVEKIPINGVRDEKNTVSSVKKLFYLHLTVRELTPEIEEAVLNLVDKSENIIKRREQTIITDRDLENLPFTGGETFIVIPPAALFMATIFGLSENNSVKMLFKNLTDFSADITSEGNKIVFSHNLYRALAVNPLYSSHPVAVGITEMLADTQSERGDWNGKLPFYQTLNAAAHIESEDTGNILRKALPKLINTQNTDGSWGEGENREWNTFLAVHALKNRNLL